MSAPINGNVPGAFDTRQASFIAASGILAKVLADVAAASGNLTGGQRVFDMTVASTDSAANSLILWEGMQMTLQTNMGTAATTATTNATVTRTTGSFITDGWQVGDSAMCLGSAGASNNGNVAIVTGVAALTLTFSGVPAGFSANAEGAGFRLIRVTRRAWVSVPANAGNATSVSALNANVQVVGQGYDQTKDGSGIELGATGLLLVGLYQAVSALPATVQVTAKTALR